MTRGSVLLAAAVVAAACTPVRAQRVTAPPPAATPAADTISAPITDVRYTVSFDRGSARTRAVRIGMAFTTPGTEPVLLSLPAWTPGAYEISNFARWVSNFTPSADGRPLQWEKADHDTWRVFPAGARSVSVTFDYAADTLDNAMSWTQPDFLLLNGTTVFMYPEGRRLEFPSQVQVRTESGWGVATGMTPAQGGARLTYSAPTYHDLVDMPFFIGAFEIDSARVVDRWVRFATYPRGSMTAAQRTRTWDQIRRIVPAQAAVFQDVPFATYTVMQIADTSYGGASGLEHQNSHVNVINPLVIDHPFLPSLIAHEIFHAWNVKRLRPARLWPYRYDRPQPTGLLWVSEGITDYYADLSEVRAGVIDSAEFFNLTAGKIDEVQGLAPVSLEDASLSTWISPTDGTAYVYYPKGSLAGFLLDIVIRDASNNRSSLDEVLRDLYRTTYRQGRGFTNEDFWQAASAAAAGRSFDDFYRRYIDGREPYPWVQVLPLAGIRLDADTVREPRLGVEADQDADGIRIVTVVPGGSAARGGIRQGDYLLAIGGVEIQDPEFTAKFRARFGQAGVTTIPVRIRRGTRTLTVSVPAEFSERTSTRMVADPAAGPKAARIRAGLLHGTVDR